MKSVFVFILSLPLWLNTLYGQEEAITPSRFITKVPFRQLTGGVVLLPARFGSYADTLNFILDTGSGGISLDSLTAVYFGLKPEPSQRTIRGIGGIRNVSFLNNQQLHFPNLTIDSLNFHVNDYEMLSAVYGEKIDGIIGYSFLSRYIIKLNFDSSYMEVWTKGAMKYPRGGYLLKPLIATLPVHPVRVKDANTVESRFLYDIGAGLCVMMSREFIEDSAILDKKRKLYVKEAEGLGGKIDLHMTVVKEIKIGPYRFRKVPVYVFDDVYNITSYPYLGGLIGNDLLRRFNSIINYEKKDIHLLPNKHYNEPFDYSYSGIELYFLDGEIIVGDVAEGSPAQDAGIQEGDVVVGINRVFNNNLQQMKAALQNKGDRVKIIIKRKDELLQYDFKVKSILR